MDSSFILSATWGIRASVRIAKETDTTNRKTHTSLIQGVENVVVSFAVVHASAPTLVMRRQLLHSLKASRALRFALLGETGFLYKTPRVGWTEGRRIVDQHSHHLVIQELITHLVDKLVGQSRIKSSPKARIAIGLSKQSVNGQLTLIYRGTGVGTLS